MMNDMTLAVLFCKPAVPIIAQAYRFVHQIVHSHDLRIERNEAPELILAEAHSDLSELGFIDLAHRLAERKEGRP